MKAAASADAPVLLVHGENDTVVPIEQSRAMQKALSYAGQAPEFVLMDGDDHWLSDAATRQAMLTAVVAFVQKSTILPTESLRLRRSDLQNVVGACLLVADVLDGNASISAALALLAVRASA